MTSIPIPTPAASNAAGEPPQEAANDTKWSTLPKDIVLGCLNHIPRNDLLNVSCVSKTLRLLVTSPELQRMRSFLPKDTVYFSCHYQESSHWFTLRRSKKKNKKRKKTTVMYQLLPTQFPCHDEMRSSSNVAVGSKIYFIGRSFVYTTEVWILDTRSGELTQGPSMKIARTRPVVGVIDGKIYVLGGRQEESKVEVFNPKTEKWGFVGEEKVRCKTTSFSVTLEKKIYMVEERMFFVYDPRTGRKEVLMKVQDDDGIGCMCVVEDVLYVYFVQRGIMWLDTKVNIWRRVLSRDVGKTLDIKYPAGTAMTGYDGKLAVFLRGGKADTEVKCVLFDLVRVGEKIYGSLEWFGVVATISNRFYFADCLTVSQ
ncbi:unnamed protein product [Microthlaspi erraticum]|uniref:F-box domain-containing protein n=1 Tax=Microthlaspi erraticum TaxID=1685480 RepID=A0A6D2IWJ0_9BRAS|nr:unnamed protein product [Microthlaspi erraticum]